MTNNRDENNEDSSPNEEFSIVNLDETNQAEIMLKMTDESIELDFFKVLFLSIVMSQPKFFIDKLMVIDPIKMYNNAKNI